MVLLFVVILFLALATGEGVLYRLTYFLALGMAVSYAWTRLSLSRLDIRVGKQSSVAEVGGVLEGSIYVRNNSPIPTGWLEILQVSNMPGYVFGEVTRLQARAWAEWKTKGSCYTRGVYRIGPMVIGGSDPLGLFRVKMTRGNPVRVVVYPPVVELPYFRLPTADLSGERRVRPRLWIRSCQAGTVREYRHGDSLNRIHWPSTAKCGQLMSKEFDSGGSGELWVIVDLDRRIHVGMGVEKTDEYCATIAASVARLALAEEHSVGLIAYGDQEYLLPPAGGAKQMSRVLETLTWSKTEGEVALASVLSQSAPQFDRSASLLVVTSSADIEWVSVLHSLTCHGLRVIVAIVDSSSFGGDESCHEVAMRLVNAGIPTYLVRRGDTLALALARAKTLHALPATEESGVAELGPAYRP